MVTIGMNYVVLPGKEEVFERAFAQVLDVMKKMDGHSASHLYRDVQKANSYLIVSDWSEQAAFTNFVRSDQFKKVTDWGKEQILADRPKHTVYTSM